MPDPGGSPANPGTAAAYVVSKAADYQAFVEGLGTRAGAISPASCPTIAGGISSRVGPATTCPPSSYLLGLNKYHQKTTYYCLVAAIQSILNTKFGGYVSGGITAGQNAIATATHTTSGGTIDSNGLSYTNAQLSVHTKTPSDWLYVDSSTTSASQLFSRVQYDVGDAWPLFVMVNWNSPSWPDHGTGGPVGHASLGIGWVDPGTLYAYDPWSQLLSGGSCYFGPGYSSSPNNACYATLSSASYYNTTVATTYGNPPKTYQFNDQWY